MSPIEVAPEIRSTVKFWADTEPRLIDFQEMLVRRGEIEPAKARSLVEELLTTLLDNAEHKYIEELGAEVGKVAEIRSRLKAKYDSLLEFFDPKQKAVPLDLPPDLQPGAFEELFTDLDKRLEAIRQNTVEGVIDSVAGQEYANDVKATLGPPPGEPAPTKPVDYKSMSLAQLRARAVSDANAAFELIDRIKLMKRTELLEQARAGDPYARQRLQERPTRWTRETSDREIVSGLRGELRTARGLLSPEAEGTIGVARTNLPLPDQTFEGASPLASESKPAPGEIKPPPTQTHGSAQGHAEEVIANKIWEAVKTEAAEGRIDPQTVEGSVFIHVEQEVCSVCRQGVDSRASLGVLGQISERLPNVVFEVTAEGTAEVVRIQNGQRVY